MKTWLWIPVLFISTLLMLAGCSKSGDDNGRGQSPGRPTTPGQGPIGPKPMVWGDLKCQRASNCANPVLNIPLGKLESFLTFSFATPVTISNGDDPGVAVFQCVKQADEAWTATFGPAANDSEVGTIARFLYDLLDVNTCVHVPNVSLSLSKYFTSTNEYKNEN